MEDTVIRILNESTDFAADAIQRNVHFFFKELGLPKHYFDSTPAEVVAKHVNSLAGKRAILKSNSCLKMTALTRVSKICSHSHHLFFAAAKELAKSSGRRFEIELQQVDATSAFFAARSTIATVRPRTLTLCPRLCYI
jgi:hypothetical protein